MPYAFELTFTGLAVLTLFGADKSRPREAHFLLLGGDPGDGHGGHGGHAQHVTHLPLLSFSTERRKRPAAGSKARFKLLPGPDGRQLGIASLAGAVSVSLDEEEKRPATGLSALWRPSTVAAAQQPTSTDEERWLDWVPLLKKVNPGIKDATDSPPFAGLKASGVVARVALTEGSLRAANFVRRSNGGHAIFDFKPPGAGPSSGRQALAVAVVLRLEGLTMPVWIEAPSLGRLGLDGVDGETVRASITSLPDEDSGAGSRLVHFEQFYDVTEFDTRPTQLSAPESNDLLDTTSSLDCPCAIHAGV
jgi:hypothetical protein